MTTVALYRLSDGRFVGFEASGHTGFAESGADIVCAAVSALTQATLYGLTEVVKIPLKAGQDDQGAKLTAQVAPEADDGQIERAQVLFETLKGSLEAICREYPRNVRMIFKERR